VEAFMKKQMKKLVLAKETLRSLETGEMEELRNVVGGSINNSCTYTGCCCGSGTVSRLC
jgi:hypothetical protein